MYSQSRDGTHTEKRKISAFHGVCECRTCKVSTEGAKCLKTAKEWQILILWRCGTYTHVCKSVGRTGTEDGKCKNNLK